MQYLNETEARALIQKQSPNRLQQLLKSAKKQVEMLSAGQLADAQVFALGLDEDYNDLDVIERLSILRRNIRLIKEELS